MSAPGVEGDWGVGIVAGASVTSQGRHGAGQPAVSGVVILVERDTAVIRDLDGRKRRRSVSNLRALAPPPDSQKGGAR